MFFLPLFLFLNLVNNVNFCTSKQKNINQLKIKHGYN